MTPRRAEFERTFVFLPACLPARPPACLPANQRASKRAGKIGALPLTNPDILTMFDWKCQPEEFLSLPDDYILEIPHKHAAGELGADEKVRPRYVW